MPRISDQGRVAAAASTLTLVLTILTIQITAAVPASAASLDVVESTGAASLPATVIGSGFGDDRVDLCWDKDNGCANLGQVTPVAGSFATTIIIPADAVSGSHLIFACQSEVCSSAGIEVVGTDTTMPPEITTTTLEPTTSLPTTTSSTVQTTTTTSSSSTTTVFGTTTSQPSSSPSSTAGPTQGPGTTLVGPTRPPIFGPSPPPIFGTPTTSLPGITETTGPSAEAQDQEEDQDQEGLFGRSDADPPVPSLDSVLSGVFTPTPEASSDSELVTEALDGGTPIPQASIGPDPQAQQSSGNRSVSDFPIPDLGVWALWLAVTVGVSAVALTFDAFRQRRSR